jgi:hypothetical protein
VAVCMAAVGRSRVVEMRESNKAWQRRLNVVMGMEQWMNDNISRYVSYRGAIRERRGGERFSKGAEYLYCNLLLGKTIFPRGRDPLFVDERFHDVSLEIQLGMGADGRVTNGAAMVGRYWDEMHRLQNYNGVLLSDDSTRTADARLPVQRSFVWSRFVPHSAISKLIYLETYLRDRVRGVERDQYAERNQYIDECMIGLVLRYRCVGGFASNQHGSISAEWGRAMPEMVECFASPLNHVFTNYYSLFDEDRVFGGLGNLYASLDASNRLSPTGRYEVNPPFEETILDSVSDIVINTYASEQSKTYLVMFAPNWKDSSFFEKLKSLVDRMGPGHASMTEENLIYGHVSGGVPVVSSLMFVFVGMGCSKPDASAFISECKTTLSRSIAGASGRAAAGPGFRSDFADTMERVVQILM